MLGAMVRDTIVEFRKFVVTSVSHSASRGHSSLIPSAWVLLQL